MNGEGLWHLSNHPWWKGVTPFLFPNHPGGGRVKGCPGLRHLQVIRTLRVGTLLYYNWNAICHWYARRVDPHNGVLLDGFPCSAHGVLLISKQGLFLVSNIAGKKFF